MFDFLATEVIDQLDAELHRFLLRTSVLSELSAARAAAVSGNPDAARAFDLSPHTVKRHVANILDKLGLASRGQAAAWCLSQV